MTIYEEFCEEIPDEFLDDHLESLKSIGKMCLAAFFKDKEMHYGGAVSRAAINSPLSLELIWNTDISEGVQKAYRVMKRAGVGRKRTENGIREDMQIVIDILDQCSDLGIPKCFRAGILLLYLEMCLGVNIDE